MFLKDLTPKECPLEDNLSDSLQEIQINDSSPNSLLTDRELDLEREGTLSSE